MREIKFRGKSLIPTVDLNYLNIEHNNGWVFGTYIDGYIVNDVIEANDEYITIGNWVPVDNVGQYTGLKDKKGVEIYEYNELDGAYEVIFKDLKYSLRHISNNDIIGLQDYWRDKNGEIEVTREYTKV